MKQAGYYEGILQLRNPSQELMAYVKNRIDRDKRTLITKEEWTKHGVDLYLTSQRYLLSLGKDVKKRFGGVLRVSRKLYTVSSISSKSVYRVTVLFRMPCFKKGDIVEIKGEKWQIISMKNDVVAKSIKTGEKKHYSFESFERVVNS